MPTPNPDLYQFWTTFAQDGLDGEAMIPFVLLSAFLWGLCVAVFMQYTELGEFLSVRLTWFMTALGCGVDLLLMLLLVDEAGRLAWWHVVAVFGVSSVGPSLRGLLMHKDYFMGLIHGARDTAGE